jgi:hypothetical protein
MNLENSITQRSGHKKNPALAGIGWMSEKYKILCMVHVKVSLCRVKYEQFQHNN